MSKVNLVFTANGQDHEHACTLHQNHQQIKCFQDKA